MWYLMGKDEGHGFRKKTRIFSFTRPWNSLQEYLLEVADEEKNGPQPRIVVVGLVARVEVEILRRPRRAQADSRGRILF